MLAVHIDANRHTLNETALQVDSVLSSTFHDLIVCVDASDLHPDRINLERQYGPDPRVVVKNDVSVTMFLEVLSDGSTAGFSFQIR